MARHRRILKRTGILGGVIAVLAVGVSYLPFKPWIESQLIAALAKQGVTDVVLHVDRLNRHGVVVRDVKIGATSPLILNNVLVDYSVSGLRHKTIQGITADGLTLEAYQNKSGAFMIYGLEGAMGKSKDGESSFFTKPELFSGLPLSEVTIKNGLLEVHLPSLNAHIPLEAHLVIKPSPALHYKVPHIDGSFGNITIATGDVAVDLTLNTQAQQWEGDWSINGLQITGLPLDIPTLGAKGKVTLEEHRALIRGTVENADRRYRAAFDVLYDLRTPDSSRVQAKQVRLPWNGGSIGVNAATLPLSKNHATTFTLVADKVSIAELMKSLTGEKASGTGFVSGTIPVTITKAGDILLKKGTLKAADPGIISITPETIPGDNAQVALVRDVLKNLHYSLLSISVESDKNKELSVLLAVEGKNPDLSESRPVRLNVHLSGDVLNLLRENVMSVTNPKQLLERK